MQDGESCPTAGGQGSCKRSAGVPDHNTRLERGETLYPRTIEVIRAALEAAGVEFTNGGEPGVKLRRSDA